MHSGTRHRSRVAAGSLLPDGSGWGCTVRRVDEALVRVTDTAGLTRGTAFPVDHQGTLLTSHEAVDGLSALLLVWPGGAVRRLTAADIVPLPEYDLALLRTDAVLQPLPLAAGPGTRLVNLPGAEQTLQGGVAGPVTARYAAAERWHLIADVWTLQLDQAPHGLPVAASGSPVLDAETGAVTAVATVALRSHRHGAVLAVPLHSAAGHRVVADLLARNGASVPAYGRALNLAGVLEAAASTLAGTGAAQLAAARVDRPDGLLATGPPSAQDRPVQALVGGAGTGRSTELAALAVQRAEAAHRLPTVWLRGADLRAGDSSVLDAVERGLSRTRPVDAVRACRIAAAAHRPLLVVLDGPEEMPPGLRAVLPEWSARTGRALRDADATLLIGCRPEYWEQAGPCFAADDRQPPLILGDLTPDTAAEVARRLGLPTGSSRHPLALRLLAELRAAAPHLSVPAAPGRAELFGARVDLACLRIAESLGPVTLAHCRRLATAAAGRVHEAARRMLGPGGGALDRGDFDELFPEAWAAAVLAEGLIVPAGNGYRFAHEELSEWIQGGHLDLATAMDTLLTPVPGRVPQPVVDPAAPLFGPVPARPPHPGVPPGAGASDSAPPASAQAGATPPGTAPLPAAGHSSHGAHRRSGPRSAAVPLPPPPLPPSPPVSGPVPRHRVGPVREALLRLQDDPSVLEPWLGRLALCLDGPEAVPPDSDAHWWAANLLGSVLVRLSDATPLLPLLRSLAGRTTDGAGDGVTTLPPAVWTALPLALAARIDLLRLVCRSGRAEPLEAVVRLLHADPPAALPALCEWLRDEQLAATAVRLLRTHRRIALDDLAEALVAMAHPRADALLRELAAVEPSALCRAVDRWAHDPRPERHVAAAVHAPSVTPGTAADRALLRYAAESLLARAGEEPLHGAALAVLVADPEARDRHLPAALARYAAGDAHLTPASLAPALESHPAPVLACYRIRLHQPGEEAALILQVLGRCPAPRARSSAAGMVGEYLAEHPESAARAAAWLAARTRHGPAERAVLRRFVHDLADSPAPVREAFTRTLGSALDDAGHPHRELLPELLELLSESWVNEPMRVGDQPHGRL